MFTVGWFVLILWSTPWTPGGGITAIESRGSISVAYFRTSKDCESALSKVKKEAKYVNGICSPVYAD